MDRSAQHNPFNGLRTDPASPETLPPPQGAANCSQCKISGLDAYIAPAPAQEPGYETVKPMLFVRVPVRLVRFSGQLHSARGAVRPAAGALPGAPPVVASSGSTGLHASLHEEPGLEKVVNRCDSAGRAIELMQAPQITGFLGPQASCRSALQADLCEVPPFPDARSASLGARAAEPHACLDAPTSLPGAMRYALLVSRAVNRLAKCVPTE